MASNAPHPSAWPMAVISLICLVIMIVISVYFYRRIFCAPVTTTHPESRKIVKISIITFTLYLVGIFFTAVDSILHSLAEDYVIWNVIGAIFYVVGLHLFLLVFIYRLESLGANDETGRFSYSKKVINFFYACVCVLVVLIVSAVIISASPLYAITMPVVAIWLLLYAIVWSVLTVAFFRKIVPFIKFDVQEMGKNTADTGKSEIAIDVTSTCALIRYSLLVLIGFLSTLFNMISGMIFIAITGAGHSWEAPLDTVINAICICLLFRFSTNIYYSVCCCDACFARCFMRSVFKDAKNNEQEIYQQLIFEQTRTVGAGGTGGTDGTVSPSVGLQEIK